ncbi:hypothetical protein EDB89DRAFT_1914061 [Lactarius sanguifluus]|nr:hypothetical protein EDB89DRAFT_1914061 [Lactarius sanguifluus]
MFIWATSRRKFNLWRGKAPLACACSMFEWSGGFVIAFAKAPLPSHLATCKHPTHLTATAASQPTAHPSHPVVAVTRPLRPPAPVSVTTSPQPRYGCNTPRLRQPGTSTPPCHRHVDIATDPTTSADPTTLATKAPTATSTPASPTCPTSTLDSPRAVNHHRCPNPAAPGLRFALPRAYRLHRNLSTSTTPSAPVDPDPATSTSSRHHPTTTPPTVLSHRQPPPHPPRLNAATPAAPSSPQRRHRIPTPLRHPGRATAPAITAPTTATTSVAPEPSGYYHH